MDNQVYNGGHMHYYSYSNLLRVSLFADHGLTVNDKMVTATANLYKPDRVEDTSNKFRKDLHSDF